MAELVILTPAQREMEEIALLHLSLSGPKSARRITDLIYRTLERLEQLPLSGHPPRDRWLAREGYRLVIAGKYIAVYRYFEAENKVCVSTMFPMAPETIRQHSNA